MIATSGQRQESEHKEMLPDSIKLRINKLANAAVKDSAWIIDSIVGKKRVLREDIIPDTPLKYNTFRRLKWVYKIRGTDTIFLHTIPQPL